MSRPQFTSGTCPTCQTHFDQLPVDYDEDGDGCAILEVTPCAQPACGAMLCACCEQFACDGCGHTFCSDHVTLIPDGAPRGLRCCPACAEESEPVELPAPIPPQSEHAIPVHVEVA